MSVFLLPNAGGGQEPDRVRHSRLVYTYKRVVCVCLSVGLSAFYRPHDICPLCGAASESESRSRRRASGQAHALARARARMPYNFSTKKSLR